MKSSLLLLFVIGTLNILVGQKNSFPEFQLEKSETEGHLRFLASDALEGRMTGERGNDLAANYIASYFQSYGLQTVKNADAYFQGVPFEKATPPKFAELEINKLKYEQGKNLMILSGPPIEIKKTAVVFVKHGWIDESTNHNDFDGLDLKGKIVIALPGMPDKGDNASIIYASPKKIEWAKERGALGLIELYRFPTYPWKFFVNNYGSETLKVLKDSEVSDQPNNFVHGWLKEDSREELAKIINGKKIKANLSSSGYFRKIIYSNNVIGWVEGSDPVLKNEYVLITAHYDHIGVGKRRGLVTPKDSIFNGARDNGMGVTALLATAKSISKIPTKRSVAFLAVTGEEKGLLGSKYYADHPLIPLHQTVFNLNSDGAGYNDTNIVSVIGFGRTQTDKAINTGVQSSGLEVFPDPAPEQNLFDRSDNVSFAKKGIPALTVSPGFTGFTQDLAKHYHQVSDEADTVDYEYLLKFCQSFAHTARLIADMDKKPFWISGDKYESAGKKLYNNLIQN